MLINKITKMGFQPFQIPTISTHVGGGKSWVMIQLAKNRLVEVGSHLLSPSLVYNSKRHPTQIDDCRL